MNKFKIIPLGGVGAVTKNMFVYETEKEIIIVDCGIGFPDEPNATQEELFIPDFSYLLERKHKIKGLFITHAHFDHYGAIPHFFSKINASIPIFSSQLATEFIKGKVEDFGLSLKNLEFINFTDRRSTIFFRDFKVTAFHINHSVPQSLGLFIETPLGNVFHVADYKFDLTPFDDQPFDIHQVAFLSRKQPPLLLLSDCLGATKEGYTKSEANIEENFTDIMYKAKGLVLVTTVTSNISRIKQAVVASINTGRKIAFLGKSMEQSVEIGRKLGYFHSLKKYFIEPFKVKKSASNKITVIAAGSYGQKGSALDRISRDKHRLVKLGRGDTVIFSADPSPPGVGIDVNALIDNLAKKKVDIHYYETQENLYVSGHGASGDIKMLLFLTKAKYLLPIGGDYRHMYAYSKIAQNMGYQEDKVLLLEEGKILEFLNREKFIVT